jgi:hypothetical protein
MLAPACLSAYLDGLLDAGTPLPSAVVRRVRLEVGNAD